MSGDDALARLLEHAQMMVRESADDDFHSDRNEEDTDIHEGRERAYRDMVDAIAREMRQEEAAHSEDQVEAMARVIHSIAWPNATPRDRDRDVWETCVRLARHALASAWRDGTQAQGDAESFGMDATDDDNPYLRHGD